MPALIETNWQNRRISLVPLSGEDWEYACLSMWLSNPQVLEFYEGRDKPVSLEAARRMFDPQANRDEGCTPCFWLLDEQPVGYLQFYRLESEEQREYGLAGIVYGMDQFIGAVEWWGRGLGTALVRMTLDYCFDTLPVEWMVLDPHVRNLRAIRCYEHCGFQKLRLVEKHELHEGVWEDCWLMGVDDVSFRRLDESGMAKTE